ncbi:hypothetical protein LPJ70_004549 [Coemansia sp. RSA 2708]|nr:hypothetical protein LPJ70_004549 [Coemansia sp. RSA 2708]KAJ2737792.1 hypothetical protein H4R23_001598 [Coemansia sp. Cherry 401B]
MSRPPPLPIDLVKDTAFSEYSGSATALTGGLVNHVWRLASARSPARTVVVKYAAPELASAPGVAFSVERMRFEARALALFGGAPPAAPAEFAALARLGEQLPRTDGVRLPRLLHYEPREPFVVLEDLGALPSLHAWAREPGAPSLCPVAAQVGRWLARLHGFGRTHLAELRAHFTNTPARALLADDLGAQLCGRLAQHASVSSRPELVARVREFAGRSERAPQTLVFGDLWSGAVLCDPASPQIALLDLEFADIASIHADVAHFAAHLLLIHFVCATADNPNVDPCPRSVAAFLDAYRATMRAEFPRAFAELVCAQTIALCTVFLGIDVARDVLSGFWCRCATKPEDGEPLTCACADVLLELAAAYICECPDSLFNRLLN